MPVKVNSDLPAKEILEQEEVFLISSERAKGQDIRPLKILILNLMPKKTETEVQLLRLLGNTPLQVEIELMQPATHSSKNTSLEYLKQFYTTYDQVKATKYDGMIITGAPVEQLPFEEVDYWPELESILKWSKNNVYSVFHICWGALAGLYYHHGIAKRNLEQKLSGVFRHEIINPKHPLIRGFDDYFYAPHSRNSGVALSDVEQAPDLEVLAYSQKAGVSLIADKEGRRIYATGHGEYDRDTLGEEYQRDLDKGLFPQVPDNYFPNDDPSLLPRINWRSHQTLLFSNWLNYFVYQKTPYDINKIN